MTEFMETVIDKFTFRVDPGCLYSAEGIWARVEDGLVRLGVSDYLQQRSGDIAFVDVKPTGTVLAADDEFAALETVKTNLVLASPVSGKVAQVNPALLSTPELINQDPFGHGWLCQVELSNWDGDRLRLLDARTYFEVMRREAEEAQRP